MKTWLVSIAVFSLCFCGVAIPGKPPAADAGKDAASPPAGAAAKPVKIEHAAVGAKVIATSTHKGVGNEAEPEAVVDGDLSTRWSSEYSAPQWLEIYLPKMTALARVRLHWEQACAANYSVSLLSASNEWKKVYLYFNPKAKAAKRVDDIDLKDARATAIRLDLLAAVNTNWGFSLYEVEAVPSK